MLPIDSSDIYFIQDGLKCLKTFKFKFTFESEFNKVHCKSTKYYENDEFNQ